MQVADFLQTVVTSPEGNFCLATKNESFWKEYFFSWPNDLDAIVSAAAAEAEKHNNVYFCAHLFSEPQSLKQYVLPSRTIQADLDHASVASLAVMPTILVQTSAERHQGYWITERLQELDKLELIGRRIAYGVQDCDKTGWPAGHKMRLPGTINYKYPKPHKIEISGIAVRAINLDTFNIFPDVTIDLKRAEGDITWVSETPTKFDIPSAELLAALKGKISTRVYAQYTKPAKDRSAALWALMCELFKAEASRDEVYHVCLHSANNKFEDRKYHGLTDLRKDILRAERYIATHAIDLKAIIMDLRHTKGELLAIRRLKMGQAVINHMREHGEFVHSKGGSLWYLRRTDGRPIFISQHSEWLNSYLSQEFGLNSTEQEQKYVVQELISYVRGLGISGDLQSLSFFDSYRNTLLLHTGSRSVLHIAKNGIESHPNGYGSIVFNWGIIGEAFSIEDAAPLDGDWWDVLFKDVLYNLLGMSREEAVCVLRAWILFLLMRNMATTRPLLAFLGQPGCLSGTTVLGVRRGEHSERFYTMAEMFAKLSRGTWDTAIPTKVKSLKDGLIQWRRIKSITSSGVKTVYSVGLSQPSNGPVKATKDHRFLTPTGYKALHELQIGDEVITQGYPPASEGKTKATRAIVSADYHPHARQKFVGKRYYGSILRCRAVIEADMNNLSLKDYRWIIHQDKAAAAKLEYLPSDVHIHHKDRNPENDERSNLEYMSKLEHDSLHGHDNVQNLGYWSGMWTSSVDTITSITAIGEQPTYDIEMADADAPNFLVNGVVVHNSGKTTTAKIIYRLLYGRFKSLSGLGNAEDFDMDVSSFPFVTFDNVDTWTSWLPDRLAQSAGNTTITIRKLYTDIDTIQRDRQGLVAVTAHNPRFAREDITDRLLMFNMKRLQHFGSESVMLNRISDLRTDLWGAIVKDLQHVLQTPEPQPHEIPQFRIEDFARLGAWFSKAVSPSMLATFHSGILKIQGRQRGFNLDEEYILVEAIKRFLEKHPDTASEYLPVSVWWTRIMNSSTEAESLKRQYKTSQALGRKLWVLQDSLKSILDVDVTDSAQGARIWKITLKDQPVLVK